MDPGHDSFDSELTVAKSMRANQISVANLLWITTATALLLAYATRIGPAAIWLAAIYIAAVVIIGLAVGLVRRDLKNALFWGGLYAMLAYLAVAGGHLPHPSVGIGWGILGAVVGSCAGTRWPRDAVVGTLTSAVLGWLAMAATVWSLGQSVSGLIAFDAISAALVAALLRPFTSVLQWLERESHQPRAVLASWLAISVLVGNFLVPILGGVPR